MSYLLAVLAVVIPCALVGLGAAELTRREDTPDGH